MKKNMKYLIGIIIALLIISCEEDEQSPLEHNNVPPGNVENLKIENKPGIAKLTYILPDDPDLLYVKATYQLKSGKYREVKASYYTNTMILDGFGDEKEYEVKLVTVNRSEIESKPLYIKVNPLENPIWSVFRSLKIESDFSGFRVTADNTFNSNLSIELSLKDSLGVWNPFYPYIYTSSKKIEHIVRGLDTIPYYFSAVIRDEFMNYTDTLYSRVKPYYEIAIPKNLFKEVRLPGDAEIQKVTAGIPLIWDGITDAYNWNRLMTETYDLNPQWITFDLGQEVKLNRFKVHMYCEDRLRLFYYGGQLRFFEVWGSLNPDSDGSWDSWIKLGDFEVTRPSGLSSGEPCTSEDWEKAIKGFDFNFDLSVPKVRYLRIKSIENWEGSTFMEILEFTPYGTNL